MICLHSRLAINEFVFILDQQLDDYNVAEFWISYLRIIAFVFILDLQSDI